MIRHKKGEQRNPLQCVDARSKRGEPRFLDPGMVVRDCAAQRKGQLASIPVLLFKACFSA